MKHRIGRNLARLALSFVMVALGASPQTKSALETNAKGWRDILPDATFNGWTRVPIPPTATLTPETQWRLDAVHRVIVCDGDKMGHEWLRYDRVLSDFLFHVEFRFTKSDKENPRYNSGIFVRNSADGKIWQQAQVGSGGGGFIFGDTPVKGEVNRVNLSKQMKEQRVKPAGEWNTFELRCEGRTISLWVNGAVTSEFTECEVPEGYLGLEAEGYRIEFRNLKVKELK